MADGVSAGGLVQIKLSMTVARNPICVYRSKQFSSSSFVFVLRCLSSGSLRGLTGALVSCACLSFVFVVHSLFKDVYCLHCVSRRACLQGKFAAHNNSVVSYSVVSTRAARTVIRGSVCVEPSSSETEVQQSVSIYSTVTCVTSQCNAATERCVVLSVLWVAVAFLNFVVRGVYMRQGLVVKEQLAINFASSQVVGNVDVSLVQGLVNNSRSLCFVCGCVQGGTATCSGASVCSDNCWILYVTSTVTVYSVNDCGTVAVEPVWGKKVLEKHLQRSIVKLVATC